jgi:hypothetical protein
MRVTALGLLRDKSIVAIRESLKDSDDLLTSNRCFCRLICTDSNDKSCNAYTRKFRSAIAEQLCVYYGLRASYIQVKCLTASDLTLSCNF